jgi:hypothetical protein
MFGVRLGAFGHDSMVRQRKNFVGKIMVERRGYGLYPFQTLS